MLRPEQGEIRANSEFGQPARVVAEFADAGSKWIHIVDLDLAFKRGNNQKLIAEIIDEFPTTSFQISGGIAGQSTLDLARDSGARRVNIASQALQDKAWLASQFSDPEVELSFALDYFQGRVVARGTKEDFGELPKVLDFLLQAGCRLVSVTDVERDGMLTGPNLDLISEVSHYMQLPVISSGGISSLPDLEWLIDSENCSGAILGKAIYQNNFSLAQALELVR